MSHWCLYLFIDIYWYIFMDPLQCGTMAWTDGRHFTHTQGPLKAGYSKLLFGMLQLIHTFRDPVRGWNVYRPIKAIVPHRGIDLRSIVKVQLLKSHVFGQIIVNLSQFRVSCYKSGVKLKLRILPKALCKLQTIQRFIFKLLAFKRVRSFFFCGVYLFIGRQRYYFYPLPWLRLNPIFAFISIWRTVSLRNH